MQHKVTETGSQWISAWKGVVQANLLLIDRFTKTASGVVRTLVLTTVLITARTGAAAGSE